MNPLLRIVARQRGLWAFCLACLLVLIACTDDKVAGGSTSTQTGTKVNLSGRVVDKNNTGLDGVVVELQRSGLKDTTDTQGRYKLEGVLEADNEIMALSATALDTLLVKREEQELVSLPVFKWVDSLPDIKVIQRDISGKLLSAPLSIGRIEAVISGEGIPADQPVVVPLFYFSLSNSYTGFAYFRSTSAVAEYVVFVQVFDLAGRLMGRSPDVDFNSLAGNIPIPDFHADNTLPKAFAGNDTAMERGGRVILRGVATPAPGKHITLIEWDAGGTGNFRQYPEEIHVDVPAEEGIYPWILRVWDDEGYSALDTVFLHSVGPAVCGTLVMSFYADGQFCLRYWTPDATGMTTTITFEVGDTAIVKPVGLPEGLPPGYTGPIPPTDERYISRFTAQGKKGATVIRVLATRSDQSKQYYNNWTITRY